MFFTTPNPRYFHLLIAISLLFIVINLLIIDLIFLTNKQKTEYQSVNSVFQKEESSIETTLIKADAVVSDSICPNSCIAKINQAVSSIKLQNVSNNTNSQVNAQTGYGKEFFVPFGTGSNATDNWADIPGNQAYIDSTQYGQIKTVTFEAGVHIPTGNETAYVRLYNATDQHPVWFSDVSLEGGTPSLLVSNPITLDPGKKLYKVQMKTSLKFQAVLDQARVHIITY